MTKEKMKSLICSYIEAYNKFDIDAMIELLHPGIEFRNYSGGELNAQATSIVCQ